MVVVWRGGDLHLTFDPANFYMFFFSPSSLLTAQKKKLGVWLLNFSAKHHAGGGKARQNGILPPMTFPFFFDLDLFVPSRPRPRPLPLCVK